MVICCRYRIVLSTMAYTSGSVELYELRGFTKNSMFLVHDRRWMWFFENRSFGCNSLLQQYELVIDCLVYRFVPITFDGGLADACRVVTQFGGSSYYHATITVLNVYQITVFEDEGSSIANKSMPSLAFLFIDHVWVKRAWILRNITASAIWRWKRDGLGLVHRVTDVKCAAFSYDANSCASNLMCSSRRQRVSVLI